MFDFVYKHKRILQLVLAIIIVPPFAFFGVDSYLRTNEATTTVASVNGQTVNQQEFNVALRERIDMMQQMSGGKLDPAMMDSPEVRYGVAELLVSQKVLLQKASREGLVAPDVQVKSAIEQLPAFQENGKFSMEQYAQFLKMRGRTQVDFESDLRRDLVLRQVSDPYGEAAFVSRASITRLARVLETQREASVFLIEPAAFESKVTISGDEAKKEYQARQNDWRTQEQVRVEYVVLSIDGLLAATPVDAEEVRQAFDDQVKRMTLQETRQASHILIAADAKAPAAEKQKAKARAEELLKQVKAKPAAFAEIAKANSQDPGSGANGGDLGTFKRGAMVKPFDDAVFGMKVGDISNVVETPFGYHIITLTAINEAKPPSFETEKGKIETELKRQKAAKAFAALAEKFNDTVFDQSDSLKPAAALAKSEILQSNFFGRNGVASDSRLNNPKLLQAVFSDEVLKSKRNTEAVEVAPGTLVAARVLEYQASVVRPLAEVQGEIVRRLTRQRAAQLAGQEGRALLEKLKKGGDEGIKWGDAKGVAYSNPVQGLDDDTRRQILRVDTSKLPAYAGLETPAGYTLIRVSRVTEPEKLDPEKQKNLETSVRQVYAQEQNAAFIASIRQKADVKLHKDNMVEKKEKQ